MFVRMFNPVLMPQFYARLLMLFAFLTTVTAVGVGQNIRISQGGRVNTCTGTLYDSGGPNGNHTASGTSGPITICSDDPGALSHIRVQFTQLDIVGELTVYGGEDTNAPVQVVITGGDVSGFNVTATESNPTGCLTFEFVSEGSAAGWAAEISCQRSCQTIEGEINTVPAEMPADTGYVDVCPGDEITFTATGIYPENNIRYTQSDATSTFTWNFQDGTIQEGVGLTTVTHAFEEPGGYFVLLAIEDADGCVNAARISQRVRVAPPPIFTEPDNLPESLCIGEEVTLTVGRDGSPFDVNFDPTGVPFNFNTSQTFSELTELPDGNGTEYSSPLVFGNFNPGQTLGSASDIVRICATMEHSYLGDLDIWLSCPDGSELDLHRYDPGDDVQRQLLGQGDQNTDDPDPPGVYCWTAAAPRTMAQYVEAFNVGSDETMPEIDYAAEEPFNSLVGCPLNGEWKLNIRDNLSNDNGYIYEWTIEFVSSLYPGQETFIVPVENFAFEDFENWTYYGGDSARFSATNAGPNTIRIISTDDYGCVYDTNVVIDVLPPYAPSCAVCGPLVSRTVLDTAICLGESFVPDVTSGVPMDTFITFESLTTAPFGQALYPDRDNAYVNEIEISNFAPAQIGNVAADLNKICVSLDNEGDLNDVTLIVRAPNGQTITLVENFTGANGDLVDACFSPVASQALDSGTPPYTGTFRPAGGSWIALNNAPINGTWRLIAFDRAGNDLGSLVSWSVDLNYDRGFVYNWSGPAGDLSCTDCPNPTITPTGPATYTLEVNTAAGCTDMATVNVSINEIDVTVTADLTNPGCPGEATGSIDLTVTGTDPSYTYSWADGPQTEDRTGLTAGTYMVSVTDAQGCFEAYEYTLTERPLLTVTEDEVIDVRCFGASNGEIRVTTTGGTAPYTFLWNDPNAQVEEDAGALTAGTYTLTVTDAVGCTTTFTTTVGQPEVLTLTFRSKDVSCRDGSDGYAVAVPAGGNGAYTYAWQTGADQDSVFNLIAGTYEVTVTDQLGCMAVASVTLAQPDDPLTATAVQEERGCFAASANRATVIPAGGTTPYTYLWSNGETTATAVALPAGQVSVVVTDDGGCTETVVLTTVDLPEVTVNIIATPPSCNDRPDGRLGAIPTGGAGTTEADYVFNWSNGQTGVAISDLPGNRLYMVTVTGPRGCSGVGERFLNAPPPITFNVDETPVRCFGESNGGLTVSNISGPNAGAFDLQWGPNAGNSTSPAVTDLPAGDNYRLTITDVDGCTADTVLRITQPPVLATNLDQLDVSCFGETDGRISAIGAGGVGGYTYAWSTGSNQNQIASLPAGAYSLTVTDANQCEDVSEITIVQPAAVTISTNATPAICEGEATGTIEVTGGGGRPPYVYGLENQGFTRNSTFIGLPQGEYIAFVRDSSGCQTSAVVGVADGPEFSLLLPPDTTIVFGDSLTLVPELTGGVDTITYRWTGSYGGTLSCTDCPAPVARPEYEIDYTLDVSDSNGCTDDQRIRVSVRKIREVATPTAFTPNADGANDVLIVHGRPGTRVLTFTVFDRWANVLYEAADFMVNDASFGWDGTAGGAPVNAGVYLYKIVVEYDDGSRETLAGESTLIR